jgi:hypothetical protein
MKCYLNISNDDAITRYCKSMDIAIEEFDHTELTVFYFSEEFEAYSVYPISDNI